jgi:hypothetical protein
MRPGGNVMADALQINCALWGMLACGEIKVAQWIGLLF